MEEECKRCKLCPQPRFTPSPTVRTSAAGTWHLLVISVFSFSSTARNQPPKEITAWPLRKKMTCNPMTSGSKFHIVISFSLARARRKETQRAGYNPISSTALTIFRNCILGAVELEMGLTSFFSFTSLGSVPEMNAARKEGKGRWNLHMGAREVPEKRV